MDGDLTITLISGISRYVNLFTHGVHGILGSHLGMKASSLVVLVFECRGANVDFGLPNRFYAATIGLSLGTNVIATALIGYVYW